MMDAVTETHSSISRQTSDTGNGICRMRSDALTVGKMSTVDFTVLAPCSLLGGYQRFNISILVTTCIVTEFFKIESKQVRHI
jgi:hypothetical protein